jgi:hypothetical protein
MKSGAARSKARICSPLGDVLGQFFKMIYNFITKSPIGSVRGEDQSVFTRFSLRSRLDLKQLALLDEFVFLSDAASDMRQLAGGWRLCSKTRVHISDRDDYFSSGVSFFKIPESFSNLT